MSKLFSASPLWQPQGVFIIRVILGLFLIYHGWEIFDALKMKEYTTWDVFKKTSAPSFMVYMGKGAELIAGILLLLGLFTRLASVVVIITFVYIAFFVGNGKVWYEDQHPFLFVLLALLFFFAGPGRWSLDYLLSRKDR